MATPLRHPRALGACLLLAASLGGCEPGSGPAPHIGGTAATTSTPAAPPAKPPADEEEDPATHVARLQPPATRAAAVQRLTSMFEDAMTRDQKNREGPTVKPLLDLIAKPLNNACLAADTDPPTRSALIKLASFTRRPEGEPCLVKALQDYQPDVTEEDVRWAARAVNAMRPRAAAGALFDTFTKMKPSREAARAMCRDVYDAMITLSDPSWEPALIANLERPLTNPRSRESQLDEVQWSTLTSAKILGDQRSEKAVPALLKVMLSPAKADAHMTSVLALVKIGKPATTAAVKLLRGEDQPLVRYAEAELAAYHGKGITAGPNNLTTNTHVSTAALVLATIGRDESRAPLLEAIKTADEVPRAIIARELPKLPRSADTMKAFQTALEKTPLTLTLPPAGQNAVENLLEAAPTFFDSSLVPWLIKLAGAAKGSADNIAALKETALLAAMKLMNVDQIGLVEKLAAGKTLGADGKPSTVGEPFTKELALAKTLVQTCGDKLDCYLDSMANPASQEESRQFTAIKAAYMVGVLGSPNMRDKLLDRMPTLRNIAVRGLAASIIDFHSPRGDTALADRLQQIVNEVDEKKDPVLMATQSHFRYVIHRLHARAQ